MYTARYGGRLDAEPVSPWEWALPPPAEPLLKAAEFAVLPDAAAVEPDAAPVLVEGVLVVCECPEPEPKA